MAQGRYREAGALLVGERRFEEAGNHYLFELPELLTPVSQLDDVALRAALNAAVCYERCGHLDRAAALFANLGKTRRAVDLLKRAGRRDDATLVQRGRPFPGAPWPPGKLSRQLPQERPSRGDRVETADDLWRAGRRPEALELLLEARPDEPDHFEAAPRVVRLSWDLDLWDARIAAVVLPWMRATDRQVDVPALYTLGRLHERRAEPDRAMEAYRAVTALAPDFEDVQDRLHALVVAAPTVAKQDWLAASESDDQDLGAVGHPEPTVGRADQLPSHEEWLSAPSSDELPRPDPGVAPFDGPSTAPDLSILESEEQGLPTLPSLSDLPSAPSLQSLPALQGLVPEPIAPEPAPKPAPARPRMARPVRGSSPGALGQADADASTAEAEISSGSWELRSDEEEAELARQLSQKSAEIGLGAVKLGVVINGRYRIDGPLGEGGFAIVFRAMDLALQEPVAIKLFTRAGQDETAVARLKQEIRIARRLAHPNIVDTYAFGTWGRAYFITMELMRGQDLREWTRSCGGVLPLPAAVHLMAQALDGLDHAHRKGVVHRDVKPQNLFVVDRGRTLKVMDFGIARAAESARLTRTGRIVGTPAYISPERLKRGFKDLSPAADLYSIGVVIYRTLTGMLPFDEPDVALLFREIMQKQPLPPSAVKPELPAAVDEVVMKLLEKDPADRYASCDEVKRALIRASVEG